jgi:LysM repeat protein
MSRRIVLIVLTVLAALAVAAGVLPAAAGTLPLGVEETRSAGQSSTTYIVQPGDTLFGIARRFGTTVTAIASASGIADVNRISVGQRLTIP